MTNDNLIQRSELVPITDWWCYATTI